jgi:FG-GAP-like repeat
MRRVLLLSAVLAAIGGVVWISVRSWRDSRPSSALPVTAPSSTPTWPPVEKFCSTCHVLPPPDVEPRHLWPAKIQEMYGYVQAGGAWPATQLPPIEVPIAYFTARAPEQLRLPPDVSGSPPSPLPFKKHDIFLDAIPHPPAISCVKFVRLTPDGPLQLLISDMRHGVVALWTPSRPDEQAQVIARIPHPCRTTVVDLDGDGILDILVANLGIFEPGETDQGSVVWLRGLGQGEYEPHTLISGLGRVVEVQAADFDGDGDLDLVVAVFGNFHTGMILYLENLTEDWSEPDFEPTVIDSHTGTSDVPIVDINNDGRPDFIALQSQQHERIVAFINVGKGRFRSELIYAAPHPRWGSTGIKLVDVDGDGRIDVLYNHGDSVQVPPIPRPYHGVSWLQNQGTFPFKYHRIAHLPGAHTCQPADLQGDGRVSIVSSVFIPAFNPKWPNANWLESIVWFEQTSPGQFQRYVIETANPFHPCMDAADYDGDGDIDIAIGNFLFFTNPSQEPLPCITLLENCRIHNESQK